MIHVIDVELDPFSNLFQSHRYSPLEKLYSVILSIAGFSFRDLSERSCPNMHDIIKAGGEEVILT
jgi:hypothetical protein